MAEEKLKNFDIENIFTKKDYFEFKRAVEARENYNFYYGKDNSYIPHPVTKVLMSVCGRNCDNGVWKDNYLYSLSYSYGYSGDGTPYCPVKNGILSYDEIINYFATRLGIELPKQKQVNFLDFFDGFNNDSNNSDFSM